jgi:AcrR family transcriptional regulator
MSVPYESTGRTDQKGRTRQALVRACQDLMRAGQTPTVEEVAERTGISRTTAYRYFPNQRSLLLAAQPELQPETLLPDDAPTEIRARLDAFMTAFTAYNLEWEPQLRAALRVSLDADAPRPVLRGGRAVRWLEDALAPLKSTHPHIDIKQLAVQIRSATGIEALVWLRDVAGLGRAAAGRTVRANALAILHAALAQQ